jgi:hypothetical protein
MSYLRVLCLFEHSGVQPDCFCSVFLRLAYYMLSLSLDCPFLIAHSIFFNVDLHLDKNKRIFLSRICKYDRIKEQVYIMRNYPILHFDKPHRWYSC